MFYESLFNPSIHRPVKACLTGAGEFGASFLFQAQGMPLLEVPAVCTRTVQRAVDAYENAGIPASKVRVCESAEDAKKAYADGFNVVVDSFEYIADLPLDVLVESSGATEASAAAAELAIERGMHVVMVSKETDSVVGSILARKAAERGLVYTTGDGDQPSLLIGLISWGRRRISVRGGIAVPRGHGKPCDRRYQLGRFLEADAGKRGVRSRRLRRYPRPRRLRRPRH